MEVHPPHDEDVSTMELLLLLLLFRLILISISSSGPGEVSGVIYYIYTQIRNLCASPLCVGQGEKNWLPMCKQRRCCANPRLECPPNRAPFCWRSSLLLSHLKQLRLHTQYSQSHTAATHNACGVQHPLYICSWRGQGGQKLSTVGKPWGGGGNHR